MTTLSDTKLGVTWSTKPTTIFHGPDDCFERYIDPKDTDLAIRSGTGPDGGPLEANSPCSVRRGSFKVGRPVYLMGQPAA